MQIIASMIGFVTWPPFLCQPCYKGGQVAILVKTWLYLVFQKHLDGDFLASADIKDFGPMYS